MKKLITCGAAVLAVFCACDKNIEPEPAPLAPPAEVWLSASSGTSLTFSWTEVEDAVRYALRLDRSDDGSNVSQTSVTGTSHTFSGLETGTEYVFKVRAVASDDKLSSSYSEEYKALIPTRNPTIPMMIPTFPTAPTNSSGYPLTRTPTGWPLRSPEPRAAECTPPAAAAAVSFM